jgi:hypothetical protein
MAGFHVYDLGAVIRVFLCSMEGKIDHGIGWNDWNPVSKAD